MQTTISTAGRGVCSDQVVQIDPHRTTDTNLSLSIHLTKANRHDVATVLKKCLSSLAKSDVTLEIKFVRSHDFNIRGVVPDELVNALLAAARGRGFASITLIDVSSEEAEKLKCMRAGKVGLSWVIENGEHSNFTEGGRTVSLRPHEALSKWSMQVADILEKERGDSAAIPSGETGISWLNSTKLPQVEPLDAKAIGLLVRKDEAENDTLDLSSSPFKPGALEEFLVDYVRSKKPLTLYLNSDRVEKIRCMTRRSNIAVKEVLG